MAHWGLLEAVGLLFWHRLLCSDCWHLGGSKQPAWSWAVTSTALKTKRFCLCYGNAIGSCSLLKVTLEDVLKAHGVDAIKTGFY
jgi:hypothetical protein